MRAAASIISVFFHPLFVALYCVLIAGELDWQISGLLYPDQRRVVYLIVALSTIAFPGANMLLLHWYGAVSSLHMPVRRERFAPYLSSIFFFVLGYILLRRGALPLPIYSIMLGGIITALALVSINLFSKWSAHAAGAAGLLACVLGLFQLHAWQNMGLLMAAILICGLVLTSRLLLKAHTPREVYGGAIIGFAVMYASITLQWAI